MHIHLLLHKLSHACVSDHFVPFVLVLLHLPPTQCPFIRGVYLLSGGRKGASVLGRLLNRVTDVNLSGLCLNEMPEDVQMAALSTYKLTR